MTHRSLNRYVFIGSTLLIAYFVQDYWQLKWTWLVNVQKNNIYKQISGFILITFILLQWRLAIHRFTKEIDKYPDSFKNHQHWGAFTPLFFYLHAHTVGYAYLFFLSTLFFLNYAIGLWMRPLDEFRRGWVQKMPYKLLWFRMFLLFAHISLSSSLLILMNYHVYISYLYE